MSFYAYHFVDRSNFFLVVKAILSLFSTALDRHKKQIFVFHEMQCPDIQDQNFDNKNQLTKLDYMIFVQNLESIQITSTKPQQFTPSILLEMKTAHCIFSKK